MDNDAIIEFINTTLAKIRAIPNAMDNDREVFDLFHALLLIESNFSGDPDDGFLRITLKYFDPDDTHPHGRGRLINPLYEVLKGVEGNKEMIDGFLSWVRLEIERIDGPPPPPVGSQGSHEEPIGSHEEPTGSQGSHEGPTGSHAIKN